MKATLACASMDNCSALSKAAAPPPPPFVQLTVDHKPELPTERARIEAAGMAVERCVVRRAGGSAAATAAAAAAGRGAAGGAEQRELVIHRVNGRLAVSRAIGDTAFKPVLRAHAARVVAMAKDGSAAAPLAPAPAYDASTDAVTETGTSRSTTFANTIPRGSKAQQAL